MYEAKALFANIDNIVPASIAFSQDLDEMFNARTGPDTVGDICLRHVSKIVLMGCSSVDEGLAHFRPV